MSSSLRPTLRLETEQGPVLTGVSFQALDSARIPKADANNHRLIWPRSGSLEIRTDHAALITRPPVGVWIPAGSTCSALPAPDAGIALFDARSCPAGWSRMSSLTIDDVVPSLLSHLHRYPERRWGSEFASAVVEHLQDAFVASAPALALPADPRARAVTDGLLADPSDNRDLAEWAQAVGASETNLRRLFRVQTGMPFQPWRHELRMQVAMRKLELGTAVGQIAAEVGYSSGETFNRAFRSHTGLSPSAFRSRFEAATTTGERPKWQVRQESETVRPAGDPQELITSLAKLALQGDVMLLSTARRTLIAAALLLLVAACGDGDSASEVSAEGGDDAAADAAYPRTIEHAGGTTTIESAPELAIYTGVRAAVGDALAMGVEVDFLARTWDPDDQWGPPQAYFDAADELGVNAGDGPEFYVDFSIEDFIALDADVFIINDADAEFLPEFDQLRELVPTIVLPTTSRADFQRVLADTFAVDPARLAAIQAEESELLTEVGFPSDIEVSLVSAYNYGGLEVEVFNETSNPGVLMEQLVGADLKEQEPVDENWAYLAEETLGQLDSDVIVNLVTYDSPAALDDSPVFQSVPAVADGRFLHLSYDESFAINFPSLLTAPLVADAVEKIADVAQGG